MHVDLSFHFEHKRCWDCGTFWAIETLRTNVVTRCPMCAVKDVRQLCDRADGLERSNKALRGAITAMRKRNGRKATS